MAKVAAPSTLPSNSLQIGGGVFKVGPMVKRKTPSELRVCFFIYFILTILKISDIYGQTMMLKEFL